MQISLQKSFHVAAVSFLIALATSTTASAQRGNFSDSFTPANSTTSSTASSLYQTNDVEALYEANSQLPLGGFFAKGFTRTFTLLGGGNFSATDLPGNPTAATPSGSFDLVPVSREIDDDVGYVISGAMGRRHNRRLRSEIEFAIRGNDFDLNLSGFSPTDVEADVSAYSLMKNVIFDFPNQSRFTPYAGAGIGISLVEVESQFTPLVDIPTPTAASELSEDDTALTYQFIGGVATRVNHAMDFVVEYRFLGTSDIELDTLGSAPYRVNNLFMGVKLEY